MISLIICSRSSVVQQRLVDNISNTIGVTYEILVHDNVLEQKSISSVYNSLVRLAQYPFVIFLHEDLEFFSNNWGVVVQAILGNKNIGLLGLSGSIYKSKYQGVWSASKKETYRLATHHPVTDQQKESIYSKVAVIDGCFMAGRKEMFEEFKFDENLAGFHGYDIDLSIHIGRDYQVVVAHGINFNHFSNGNQNLDWLVSTLFIHNKWKDFLPVTVEPLCKSDAVLSDYLSAQNFYEVVHELRYSYKIIIKYYLLFITKFYGINKFNYTKKTLNYFFAIR